MKLMFRIFQRGIKIGSLFLAIFQSFYCFVRYILDKLDPPLLNNCFKNLLNLFLVHSIAKDGLRSAKTRYFRILHFGWQAHGGL